MAQAPALAASERVLVRVYVSSTWRDLQPERKAIESALQRLRETKFVGMEYFGSHDEDTRSTSLNELDRLDLYIGVFAGRYGSGITEDEYRFATARKVPCRIYYKKESSVAPEMMESDPDKIEKLAKLKKDLRAAHTVSEFDTPDGLALLVAVDVHKWLFDEYITPRLKAAVRGAIAPEEIQELLSNVKDVGALQQDLLARLDNIFIKNAIVHSYPLLKDYIYDFEDVIDNATDGFVGREFVFEEMKTFVEKNARGYFRVVAEAGLGKTALAATVSRRFRAPSFFANTNSGLNRADQCLNHLSAELIARFDLDRDHLPPRSGEDSAFLSRVLAEAAKKKSADPLWIVVDAVDEGVAALPGQNPFRLPSQLPAGVFFFVTHRNESSWLTEPETSDFVYRLRSSDDAQDSDIQAYLRNQAQRPEVQRVLLAARPPITVEGFVQVLANASEGNFKYLDYVVADIAAERLPAGALVPEVLPKGLYAYYDAFWESIKTVQGKEGWSDWDQLYRPVIALLAVARQPVDASWLSDLTGRSAEEIEERALRRWERFLSQERSIPSNTWRIVHRSFADFLAAGTKVNLKKANDVVAKFYLKRWGTLEAGLPGLADPSATDLHGGYGLRNLVTHLNEAALSSEMHGLLRLEAIPEDGNPDNVWREAHERRGEATGYLRDLEVAWKAAEEASNSALARQAPAEPVGLETRYALMTASMGSLLDNIPPSLIAALLKADLWREEQAYSYALLVPSDLHRAESLGFLAEHLSAPRKRDARRNALAAARSVQDAGARAGALVQVAHCLEQEERPAIISQAFADVQTRAAEIHVSYGLATVAGDLDDSQLEQALTLTREMKDDVAKLIALCELIPFLSELGFTAALSIARSFEQATPRAQALSALARFAPESLKSDLLGEALSAVRAIGPDAHRASVLVQAAPILSQDQVAEAIRIAGALQDESWRRTGVMVLSACLVEPAFQQMLDNAESEAKLEPGPATGTLLDSGAVDQIRRFESKESSVPRTLFSLQEARDGLNIVSSTNSQQRGQMLAALIPRLPDDCLDDAVQIAGQIEEKDWSDAVQFALAPRRPEVLLGKILNGSTSPRPGYISRLARYLSDEQKLRLIKALRSVARGEDRRAALQALAPFLSPPLLREAEKTASAIGDGPERARTMIAFTTGDLPEELVRKVIAVAESAQDVQERAQSLSGLLPRVPESLKPDVRAKALSSLALIDDLLRRSSLKAFLDPESLEQDLPAAVDKIDQTIENAAASIPEGYAKSALGNFLADVNYGNVQRLLSIFGRYLEGQRLMLTLERVRSIKFPRPRAHALANLARTLSGPLKEQVRAEALSSAWESEQVDVLLSNWYTGSASTPADVISALHSSFSETHLMEAIARAQSLVDPFSRAATMSGLMRELLLLPDPNRNLQTFNELFHAAWKATSSLEREWDWADMTGKIFPLLGDAAKSSVLQRMQTLKDGGSVVAILRVFGAEFSEEQWPEVLHFVALMPPGEVDKEFIRQLAPGVGQVRPEMLAESGGRGAQAKAVAVLAPYVPEPLLADVLELALRLDRERDTALSSLVPRIAQLPPARALALFRKTLRTLAVSPRGDCLKGLKAMVPVISMGGSEAAAETIRAVVDCGRWWP